MELEPAQIIDELETLFRQTIETSVLIDSRALRERTLALLTQWSQGEVSEDLKIRSVRAFLLAAWELHPLPPRLERQLPAFQDQPGLKAVFWEATQALPHKLVEAHWNLVRKAAGRYHVPSDLENEAEFQELMSVGREALFLAAQKFYRRPRGNFRNFAWSLLRERMRDEQARRHPVPAKIRKKLAALSDLRESYRLSDKTLDKQKIAEELKLGPQELQELLQIESIWGNGLEFETDVMLEDLEAADHSLDQLAFLLEIEDANRLELALAHMEGLERQLLKMLYFEEKSLRQVAEELNMSLPSFKKLHKRALLEMRSFLDEDPSEELSQR